MNYNKFGNTGVDISALGFGCMRFKEKEIDGKMQIDEEVAIPMLLKAYESGVNYFDTAVFYCNSNSQKTVGKALKSVRNKVNISTKIPLEMGMKEKDFWTYLENSLRDLDTDYIDFYHFHGIDKNLFDEIVIKENFIGLMQKAKDQGIIRHISFSFHDDPRYIKYMIDKAEIFESMLIQYNLLDRANEEGINYAASKGLGVVAMGPVAGGRLGGASTMLKDYGGKSAATYELALKFVLGNKNISCALSGMTDEEMLLKNINVVSETITNSDNIEILKAVDELKKFNELYCTGCNYCMPCPVGVNIPKVFELYNLKNVYGMNKVAEDAYKQFVASGEVGKMANSCVACKKCEAKCPQKLQIAEKMILCNNSLSI
ncbi:MAG: aldo/keto reductase [Clostridia bacterium]